MTGECPTTGFEVGERERCCRFLVVCRNRGIDPNVLLVHLGRLVMLAEQPAHPSAQGPPQFGEKRVARNLDDEFVERSGCRARGARFVVMAALGLALSAVVAVAIRRSVIDLVAAPAPVAAL